MANIGKKIVFMSLEMTKMQIVERFLVQVTQVSAWDVRTGKEKQNFIDKVTPMIPEFETMNFRVIDDMGRTVNEIKQVIRELERQAGAAPDVIIIDFVQLIKSDAKEIRSEAIGEYLNDLKELAQKHNIAILVCSQLNREASKNTKGRPKLANLKSSGAIEELADCVLMAWWEELGTEEHPEGFKYWIIVGKQRFGSPGAMVPVVFDKDKLTFHEAHEKVTEWVKEQPTETQKIAMEIEREFPGVTIPRYNPGEIHD